MAQQEIALIVGAGPGLSASLARLFKKDGMKVTLAGRETRKLDGLVKEIDGRAYACDASIPKDVEKLFDSVGKDIGDPNRGCLQRQRPGTRSDHRAGSRRGAQNDHDYLLRRISRRAGGRETDDQSRQGNDTVYRGFRERQGICEFPGLCHGQDGFDRAGPKHGAGAAAAEYPCCSGCDRRWYMQPDSSGARHIARP